MPEHVTLDIVFLLELCGAIVAVGAALAYIKKFIKPLFKPVEELNARMDGFDEKLKALEEKQLQCVSYFANDKQRLDSHEKLLTERAQDYIIMMESIALLMKHAETGNNTGEVAEGREKLEKYLIHR